MVLPRLIAIVALVLAGVQGASAQSTSNYLSGAIGTSHFQLDCPTSCDSRTLHRKILYGYRVTTNWAVEGSFSRDADISIFAINVPGGYSFDTKAIGLGGAYLLPFGTADRWTGIVRAGAASVRTSTDATVNGLFGPLVVTPSRSTTKVEPYLGLGIDFDFTRHFAMGLAWDAKRAAYVGGNTTIHSYQLVASVKF